MKIGDEIEIRMVGFLLSRGDGYVVIETDFGNTYEVADDEIDIEVLS